MYPEILKIEECKRLYRDLETERNKLHGSYVGWEQGAEKHKVIPKLENEMKKVRTEFESLAVRVEKWIATFSKDDKYVAEIIKNHYLDFYSSNLQTAINNIYEPIAGKDGEGNPCYRASNIRSKIRQIWLNEIKKT